MAMQRSPGYSYPPGAIAAPSRYASTHATSSAFSASANPNEDWTKISDLAERRRIQNRIAQRNYRKKLKRRLEDLERRACSSSASPEQSHSELATVASQDVPRELHDKLRRQSTPSSVAHEAPRASPEIFPLDDPYALFDTSSARRASSPCFNFSSYAPLTPYNIPFDQHHQHHQHQHQPPQQPQPQPQRQHPHQHQPPPPPPPPPPPASSSYEVVPPFYQTYAYPVDTTQASLPPTLPAMMPVAYGKPGALFGEEDFLSPFNMNYATLAGLDMPSYQTHAGPASTHTPPLTDPFSVESTHDSPGYFDVPITPISRTASPNVHLLDPTCV